MALESLLVAVDDTPTDLIERAKECDIYVLFNRMQSLEDPPLLIDTRIAESYDKLHVIKSINIPKSEEKVNKTTILSKLSPNQEHEYVNILIFICDSYDKKHCSNILKAYEKVDKYGKIFYLGNGFESFSQTYPFLCEATKNDTKEENESKQATTGNDNDKNNTQKTNKKWNYYDEEQFGNDVDFEDQMELPPANYPNSILNDELYLGDWNDATNKTVVTNLGITHIVNCTKNMGDMFSASNDKDLKIQYCDVMVDDYAQSQIGWYFTFALSFIDRVLSQNVKNADQNKDAESKDTEVEKEKKDNNDNNDNTTGKNKDDKKEVEKQNEKQTKKKNRVLVHCRAGVSRSATITIAYLMKRNDWTFEKSIEYVRERRVFISPNYGFVECLQAFDKILHPQLQGSTSISLCSLSQTETEITAGDDVNNTNNNNNNNNNNDKQEIKLDEIKENQDNNNNNNNNSNDNKESENDNKEELTKFKTKEAKLWSHIERYDVSQLYLQCQRKWQCKMIDIRSKKEFCQSHIKNAINIPVGTKLSSEFPWNFDNFNENEKENFQIVQNMREEMVSFAPDKIVFIYNLNTSQMLGDISKIDFNDDGVASIEWCQHVVNVNLPQMILYPDNFESFLGKYPFFCYNSATDGTDIEKFYQKQNLAFTYPSMIISDKIWLGDYDHATSFDILTNLGITHILNCASQAENKFEETGLCKFENLTQFMLNVFDARLTKAPNDMKMGRNIEYLKIHVVDDLSSDILQYLDDAMQFIDKGIEKDNKLLVHCMAGRSRSVTVLIAYLMNKKHMSLDDAYDFVKARRDEASPNPNFMEQLETYQASLNEKNNSKNGCKNDKNSNNNNNNNNNDNGNKKMNFYGMNKLSIATPTSQDDIPSLPPE